MKKLIALASLATAVVAAAPASATIFDFTTAQSTPWTADGITMTVTGWSTNPATPSVLPAAGTTTAWRDYGFGVVNAWTDNSHTIDNSGYQDFVRLEFSKAVTLTGVGLKAFGDTDAWVSYASPTSSLSTTAGWNSFLANGVNFAGGTADRAFATGMTAASTVWLIGAGRNALAGTDDAFKLAGVSVSAVPEPASWAMMIVGVGLVGGALRRRSATRTTVSFA